MNYHRSDYDDLGGLSDDQVNRYFTSGWIAFIYVVIVACALAAMAMYGQPADAAGASTGSQETRTAAQALPQGLGDDLAASAAAHSQNP